MESDEKPMKPPRTAAETLAVILAHVAEDEAEDTDEVDDTEPTEEEERWAREQHAKMQARIAEMRRQHTPSHTVLEHAVPISPAIRALTREELLAQLEVVSHSRMVQYAHRNLTGLTDDDLRQMLAILGTPSEE